MTLAGPGTLYTTQTSQGSSPGAAGVSVISVPNAASSATADTGALTEGQILFVQSYKRYFSLALNNASAPNGTTVLAGAADTRKWLWLADVETPVWAQRWSGQTVTIDPVAGNDENTGLAGSPLLTIAEFWRRLRDVALVGAITVAFASAPLATDLSAPLRVDLNGFNITIVGGRTQQRASALTAATAVQNPAAAGGGTATVLGDTAIANWTADVNALLRVTAGANLNNCCWVLKDTGGAGITARGGVTRTLAAPGSTGAAATIASTNAYAIETPWVLFVGDHDFLTSVPSGTGPTVTYQDFELRAALAAFVAVRANGPVALVLQRCRALAASAGAFFKNVGGVLLNCQQCLWSGAVPTSGETTNPCLMTGNALVGGAGRLNNGVITLQGDTYVQAAAAQNALEVDTAFLYVSGAQFACFDGTVAGVLVGRNAILRFGGLVWGQSAVAGSKGLVVLNGNTIAAFIASIPSVTGVAGDFQLDQAANFVTYNALGVPAAPQACTWANLAALALHTVAVDPVSGTGVIFG